MGIYLFYKSWQNYNKRREKNYDRESVYKGKQDCFIYSSHSIWLYCSDLMAALGVGDGHNKGKILIQFVVALAVIIVSVAAYILRKKTKVCELTIAVSMALGYVVLILLNSTDGCMDLCTSFDYGLRWYILMKTNIVG